MLDGFPMRKKDEGRRALGTSLMAGGMTELVAEVKKRDWATISTGGEELQATAKGLMVEPPEMIERIKRLLAKKKKEILYDKNDTCPIISRFIEF